MNGKSGKAPLRLITSGAFAAALVRLLPVYREANPGEIDLSFGSSLGAAHDSIPTRLAGPDAIASP